MRCFHFADPEKDDIRCSKSSVSYTTDDIKPSGSELDSRAVSNTSADSFNEVASSSFSPMPINLRVFTISDLRIATRNFSRSLMLGEGGFGCVYRGTIRHSKEPYDKVEIAVKQLGQKGLQGYKEWVTEVKFLGVVNHPNLVKLIGYCAEDDERGIQRLLVYEFMPNRSAQDHLLARVKTPLSWPRRLKVALDAARGLTYLHEGMDFQIIFRDLKTSNILLDENWNAKLSDFGLARLGPEDGLSYVSTAVMGSIGYMAPEYIQTGHLTMKNDVWSYGVVLYELLTGRPPLDMSRPKCEQNLLGWVKPYLSDVRRFKMIWDPRIRDEISMTSARRLVALANKCLARQPRARPKMNEVVEIMNHLVETSVTGSPKHPLSMQSSKNPQVKKKKSSLRRIVGKRISEVRCVAFSRC